MQPKRDESRDLPLGGEERPPGNQRERNISKSREIFDLAVQTLQSSIFVLLFFFDYLLCDGSGERMINTIIPDLYIPPRNHACNQKERNHVTNRSGGGGPRDQKSRRFLVTPPAPKISEILELLAFLLGSNISELLEGIRKGWAARN